jgi:hypothetical protein
MSNLTERLNLAAQRSSEVSRQMAEAKSLRQESNEERRTDLYMWSKPEDTLEGQASTRISQLEEALRPFAAKADEIERVAAHHQCAPQKIGRSIDYADCVAARQALGSKP